jgi:chitin disaccharide deacetylase
MTLIERALGRPFSRAVVPHVDDLGASHGANSAFLDLAARGLVTCGSVMVPGPWFREIADAASADPSLDIGVHLTLTSEWKACRWAPISTTRAASGLIDPDGYFWRDVESLRRHMVPEAAEAELRAQIERAITAGIHPTHIDAHMAAAMLPELLDLHVRLGREYGLVPVLPRSIEWAPDPTAYSTAVAGLDREGAPVFDHCQGTLAVDRTSLADRWRALIEDLPPGVTHLALHCTAPGNFESMAPAHAAWRIAEYDLFSSGLIRDLCAAADVPVLGMRAVQRLWRA